MAGVRALHRTVSERRVGLAPASSSHGGSGGRTGCGAWRPRATALAAHGRRTDARELVRSSSLGLIATGNMLRAALAAPLGFAVAALLAYVWQSAGAVEATKVD